MRRFIALAGVLAVSVACYAASLGIYGETSPGTDTGQASLTPQESWYLVRGPVTEADADLTGATKAWGAVTESDLPILKPWSTVTLAFLCYGDGDGAGNPEGGTFTYEVYHCRRVGSLEKVCDGTATVGAVQASVLPHDDAGTELDEPTNYKWVEGSPVLVSSQCWDAQVGWTKVADEVGKVSWDPLGSPYLLVRITSMSGVTSIYPLLTGR
jgi:hypothetical protein